MTQRAEWIFAARAVRSAGARTTIRCRRRRPATHGLVPSVFHTASAARDLVDERMDRDGAGAFAHVSPHDFLAESGHRLGGAGMMDAVCELADADARRCLPAVAGALAGLADGDINDELAVLVARMGGGARGGSATEQLADLCAARPGPAVRLSRRLFRLSADHPAARIAAGAWRAEPAECTRIADTLAHSADAQEAAAGITSMRVAPAPHRIAVAPAWIAALSAVVCRPDGAAASDAVDALANMCPSARVEAGRTTEDLARRHASCRSRLAARIVLHSSLLDGNTAKRYLAVCAERDLDPQSTDSIHMALAELAKTSCDAAARIAAGRVIDGGFPGAILGHALQEIGRADPGGLVAAILGKVAACRAPAHDTALASMICDIARQADLEAIFAPLFADLGRDGPSARPVHCMFKGTVTLSHDTTLDGDGLAASMLGRQASCIQARGIDAEHLAKKEYAAHLKCDAIVGRLLHPPPDMDAARALRHPDTLPSLNRAFGPRWVETAMAEAAASGQTTPPLAAASLTPSPVKTRRFLARAAPCGAAGGPSGREAGPFAGPAPVESPSLQSAIPPAAPPTRRESIVFDCLVFLDRALASLKAAGRRTAWHAKKMKNSCQFLDTISQIAHVVLFTGCYKVGLEPAVDAKRLDAANRLGPQRMLEVIGPQMPGGLDLLSRDRVIRADRAGGKMLDKAKRQIPPLGACSYTAVVAVDTSRFETTWCAMGRHVLSLTVHVVNVDRVAGKKIAAISFRDTEKCMCRLDSRTDLISAAICFKPDMLADPPPAIRGVVREPARRGAVGPPGVECVREGSAMHHAQLGLRRCGTAGQRAVHCPAGDPAADPVFSPAPRPRTPAVQTSGPRCCCAAPMPNPANNGLNVTGRPFPVIPVLSARPSPLTPRHARLLRRGLRQHWRTPVPPRNGRRGPSPMRPLRRHNPGRLPAPSPCTCPYCPPSIRGMSPLPPRHRPLWSRRLREAWRR